ncbi:MAG: glycosyltransferase [bacterium]|nr:glycosyltransferase [bacterium]
MLVIVTPGFPENENDSTCLPAIQQFVLALKQLYPANQLIIVSFQYPFIKTEYHWHGVKVVSLGGKNRSGILRVLTWFKAFIVLKKIHKRHPIRGILSLWLSECSFVSSLFSKRYHVLHYMWLQGQDAKKENHYIKRIRPKADQVIAISDFSRNEFYKNHGQMPFMIAENGIDPLIFPALNIGHRNLDILGVGSLIPVKNYALFVEIIAEIKKQGTELKVVIAGAGEGETELRKLINTLGLETTITLSGALPHSEILELMAKSNVFLHTSLYEGNSTVLIEALYSGCRVISTQALCQGPVKNLFVSNAKNDLILKTRSAVSAANETPERVLFNSMAATAQKIIGLYL